MGDTEWPAKGCELYGHNWRGKGPCWNCGAAYVELNEVERRIAAAVKHDLYDEAGRDEHAERVGRKIARALGLAITTLDQLDALPMKSIVVHNGRPFRHRFDDIWQEWGGYDYESKDVPLPAAVAWRGEK